MTWLADNWALAILAAVFGLPTAYGIGRSIAAEFQDRARYREANRLGREVESVPVHAPINSVRESALATGRATHVSPVSGISIND